VEFVVIDNRTAEYPVIEMVGIYPITFQQSSTGTCWEVVNIEKQKIVSYKPKLQADLVSFCNKWMDNIMRQQGIKPKTKTELPDVFAFMQRKKAEDLKNSKTASK
jgi:hypothetical protein